MTKMRIVVLVALMLGFTGIYGQQRKTQKLNKETNLIEVTYYYSNDQISQQGTFNLEGKLHGRWISYNEEGAKLSEGSYDNGVKTGTWYFWSDDEVKEIIFENNSIASISASKDKAPLVNKH